jgi:hypothetical protein
MTCDTFYTFEPCDGGNVLDVPSPCSCVNSTWACAPPPSPPGCVDAGLDGDMPPDVFVPPGCPPPTEVLQGGLCSVAGQECPGNLQICDGAEFYDALQCNGYVWVTLAATQCGDAGADVDASVDAEDAKIGSD